ncbi:DnaB-like helicase N-terminal domain-containing protein [Streptomyces lydicus]
MTASLDDDITTDPPQALDYAEEALVGGLLLDPRQLDGVQEMLPEHFYRPVHSALFAAMRHLASACHPALGKRPAKEEEFAWVRDTLAVAAREVPGLAPSVAHTLIGRCPNPKNSATYARMVLAGHTRRLVEEHALRVVQAATNLAHPDPVETTCARIDQFTAALDDLARRWRPHPGSVPRSAPVDAPPAPPSEERLDDERMFLATAAAFPAAIPEIRRFLLPEDFADPLHAGVFAALTGLAHRGEPIDPVTILWETQHRRLLAPYGPCAPDRVLELFQPAAGDPDYWATRVVRSSLLQAAHHQARQVARLANDTSLTPHQLITGTRRALSDFTTVRNRWHRAQRTGASSSSKGPRHRPSLNHPKTTTHQSPRSTARSSR